MNKQEFKVGDPVQVIDPGLEMLQKFAPPGSFPNNFGQVAAITEDGDVEVWFPISGDLTYKHSQASLYTPMDLFSRELVQGEQRIDPDNRIDF